MGSWAAHGRQKAPQQESKGFGHEWRYKDNIPKLTGCRMAAFKGTL